MDLSVSKSMTKRNSLSRVGIVLGSVRYAEGDLGYMRSFQPRKIIRSANLAKKYGQNSHVRETFRHLLLSTYDTGRSYLRQQNTLNHRCSLPHQLLPTTAGPWAVRGSLQ